MKNLKKFELFAPKDQKPNWGDGTDRGMSYRKVPPPPTHKPTSNPFPSMGPSFEQKVCNAAATGDIEAVSLLIVEPEFDRSKMVDHLVSTDCKDLTTLQTLFTLFPEMEEEFNIKRNFGTNEGIMDFLSFDKADDKPDWHNDCLQVYELNGDYQKFKRLMKTGAGDIVTKIDFKAHLMNYPDAKFYVFCGNEQCYFVGVNWERKNLTTFIGQHGSGPNIEDWLADCGVDWEEWLNNPPAEIR